MIEEQQSDKKDEDQGYFGANKGAFSSFNFSSPGKLWQNCTPHCLVQLPSSILADRRTIPLSLFHRSFLSL
jgi:hypothetical protein